MRYVTLSGIFSLLVLGACAQKAEIGEPCLHNVDCDTSYCLASACAAKPVQNTTTPPVAPIADAGSDAGADASDAQLPNDAPDAAVDANAIVDAATEAGSTDATSDSSSRDGGLDAASGDAHAADAAGAP